MGRRADGSLLLMRGHLLLLVRVLRRGRAGELSSKDARRKRLARYAGDLQLVRDRHGLRDGSLGESRDILRLVGGGSEDRGRLGELLLESSGGESGCLCSGSSRSVPFLLRLGIALFLLDALLLLPLLALLLVRRIASLAFRVVLGLLLALLLLESETSLFGDPKLLLLLEPLLLLCDPQLLVLLLTLLLLELAFSFAFEPLLLVPTTFLLKSSVLGLSLGVLLRFALGLLAKSLFLLLLLLVPVK